MFAKALAGDVAYLASHCCCGFCIAYHGSIIQRTLVVCQGKSGEISNKSAGFPKQGMALRLSPAWVIPSGGPLFATLPLHASIGSSASKTRQHQSHMTRADGFRASRACFG